jgi:hypothetical protein
MSSARRRPGSDDCPYVRAAQRRGQPASNETIHELHALEMARGRHDFGKRTIERQSPLALCEVRGAHLAKQLRLLPVGTLWVGVIHPINVLDDREARRSKRVSEQKSARVSAVRGQARARELMMVIGRKGAAHNGACGGKVDRKLVRDRAMLDVGDAFRRQQRGKDMAILAGFARGQRREGADRKAEVESDAVKVARSDSGARQNKQTMLLASVSGVRPRLGGSRLRHDP